jgi:hypothetical protein
MVIRPAQYFQATVLTYEGWGLCSGGEHRPVGNGHFRQIEQENVELDGLHGGMAEVVSGAFKY